MYGKSYDDKQTYMDESIKNIQKKYKIIFVIDMLYQSIPDDLLTKFFDNCFRQIFIATGTSNALDNYVLSDNNTKLINKNIYNQKVDNYAVNSLKFNPNYLLSYVEVKAQIINANTILHDIEDIDNLPPQTIINYFNVNSEEKLVKLLKMKPEESYTILHFTLNLLMNFVNSNNQYQVFFVENDLFLVRKNNNLIGYFKVFGNNKNLMLNLAGSYQDNDNRIYYNPFFVVSRLFVKNKK